jgi:4-diphosphocytidyl-2-C-methyl-D-erythritol kinase
VPAVGVSTPAAFRAWDELAAAREPSREQPTAEQATTNVRTNTRILSLQQAQGQDDNNLEDAALTSGSKLDRLKQLSLAYSSLSLKTGDGLPGTSGIVRDLNPEKKRGLPDEGQADARNDLAENTLLALVRTGIGSDGLSGLHNDFEDVVFPQYPPLRTTKRQLMGSDSDSPALYAALSGSGSALFGLYRSEQDAKAAQQRVQSSGVEALLTETLPRAEYWERMFAE